MRRSSRWNAVVVPLLGIAGFAYAMVATDVMRPRHREAQPLEQPPTKPFARAVAAVGIVESRDEEIDVAPRTPGWIARVDVRPGDTVVAGQPLFAIDATDLDAERDLRRADLAVAEAELDRLRSMPRAEDVRVARAAVAAAQARLDEALEKRSLLDAISDPRAVSKDEGATRRGAVAIAQAERAERESQLARLESGAWDHEIRIAEAEVARAASVVRRVEADLERTITRAPRAGIVLRVARQPGEYAGQTPPTPAGVAPAIEPVVVLGSPPPYCVRVDIDEEDVPKILPSSAARGMLRGQGGTPFRLEFVRFDGALVPKRALSGAANERADTRVLQAIYAIVADDAPQVVPGQQVDVFIAR
jgi:multidrug efflux pump subunit AcrA (membrane-fusion protein)